MGSRPVSDRIWWYLALVYLIALATLHLSGIDHPLGERLLNAGLLAGPAYVLVLKLRFSPRAPRMLLFSGLVVLTVGLTLYVLATIPAITGLPVPRSPLPPGWELLYSAIAFGFFHIMIACIHLVDLSGRERRELLQSRVELERSSQRYRELFNGMREAVWESELSGRFVSVNPAGLELLGYESEDDIRAIDIPSQLYVNPEDRRRLNDQVLRHGFVSNYEVDLRRADGSVVRVLVSSTVSLDESGRPKGFRGTLTDITEARAAQDEINRLEELNRNVIESLSVGLVVIDRNLEVVVYNHGMERVSGVAREQVIGRKPWDAMPGFAGTGIEARVTEALGGKTVTRERVSLLRADGTEIYVSDSFSPLVNREGDIVGVLGFLEELTARINLEQQLIQAEKVAAIGQMVSGIAHEINNPLTSVSGYAQLLLASDVTPEVREDLHKIADAADRCGQVVRGLLTYCRKHEHRMAPVDLADALERTYELKAYELSVEDIEVQRDYGENLPLVKGDRYQLQQVILNLLQNASDAIRENGRTGTIRLSAHQEGNHVVVGVFNSGAHVPESVIRRIFDPFYTTKEVGRGTGLGLSVAQNIVRSHEGVITVRNVPDGVLFEFEIPILPPAPAAPETPAPAEEPQEIHLERARILVVDDEDTIQDLFRSALPDAEVTTVDSGRAALTRLESEDWDAIVTDIKMPGGVSGLDVVTWVKDNRPELASSIVLMTGAAFADGSQEVTLPEETPVLLKPFCLSDLRIQVADAVGKPLEV